MLRGRRRPWLAALFGLAACLFLSTPLGGWLVVARDLDSPQALLVAGSHEYERLPHAASLARRWPTSRVLLTMPVVPTVHNCFDCANRVAILESLGVRSDRIGVLGTRVRNTFDELVAMRDWARERQVRRVLVVTSPYHTRRVAVLGRAVAPDIDLGVAACPVPGGLAMPWWSRRYDRRYVVYEWGALMANSWRHGIRPRTWWL